MEPLKKLGTVSPVKSVNVGHSPIGIGFEKLDRDVFDPENAYDKVADIGVKWVRIQSGWAKTEKEKGVYDFAWLDGIIDNLIRRGMTPWMCLCYGNGIYNEKAAGVFGAVGVPPIHSEEEKQAWAKYVEALTARYHGKIEWYEVWNEPDGVWCWKHGPDGREYGEFVKATAAAIRAGDSTAKVIGGSTCARGLDWLNDVFSTGAAKVMDALTYHYYIPDEENCFDRIRALRSLCKSYNPDMILIQGETGAQTSSKGQGAMSGCAWTPERQAKFMARHIICDLMDEVMFASYFSCLDMIEALNGTVGDLGSYQDYGFFGVLAADFDEQGRASGEYKPKPSYRTLQTLSAIFREDFAKADLPVDFLQEDYIEWRMSRRLLRREDPGKELITTGFTRPDGSAAFAYWKPTELLTTSYEATVSFECATLPEKVRLIDIVDGSIYEIPDEMIEDNGRGHRRFISLPLRDYPLLLTFGDFVL
ncbi:beta-galactosidase [Ruficoccus sp. ZRK36]|uniref:GH39 family glycosyl hydrolase n=1 Tax=Ruficoccus sp. ZRK36 TaxID=2866311 RepID=UPI001C72A3D7|nr:beta-galactosidase [Ruficoccus sp. ZRK36]QYY35369.1 beta-galactosidase [Ruficoccus sp. ZRK36]